MDKIKNGNVLVNIEFTMLKLDLCLLEKLKLQEKGKFFIIFKIKKNIIYKKLFLNIIDIINYLQLLRI